MTDSTWSRAVRRAQDELGRAAPDIGRDITAIGAALRLDRREAFYRELATLDSGVAFDVFLDAWWTQAVVDSATDDEDRETLLALADLAVSFRIAADNHTPVPTAEIDKLLNTSGVGEAP